MSEKNKVEFETEAQVALGVPELVAGIHVPVVTWWKHAGLRKLYLMMPILMLSATTNGYDGSLLNGLQTMVPWQDCKCDASS